MPTLPWTYVSRPNSPIGFASDVEQPLGDALRLLAGLQLEQHRELVAAHACGGVARPEAAADAARNLGEQLVAGRVSPAVVDRLEIVEVEEEDGGRGLVIDPLHRRLHAADEERAVRKAGDRVVERLLMQLLLELRDLRQRALQASVLQEHARVPGEGLQQRPVRRG